ncbi:hypothetical protein N7471_004367 [Penicillium samsonianum]|uniref:uncharacterized protein n=1 Tax=Penicillium samsonianum TaxID=1882272 RepID=UPI00254699E4|nr:uncharacterized protein N7471_004367 [Penicillium samsonianum]KAJ6137881.1 hypothetical protein N7471_004367 [Penicillium samsonianum]
MILISKVTSHCFLPPRDSRIVQIVTLVLPGVSPVDGQLKATDQASKVTVFCDGVENLRRGFSLKKTALAHGREMDPYGPASSEPRQATNWPQKGFVIIGNLQVWDKRSEVDDEGEKCTLPRKTAIRRYNQGKRVDLDHATTPTPTIVSTTAAAGPTGVAPAAAAPAPTTATADTIAAAVTATTPALTTATTASTTAAAGPTGVAPTAAAAATKATTGPTASAG